MRLSHLILPFVVLTSALATPSVGRADGFIDEVRLGVYEHDISLFGHQKESGIDTGAEILFPSPDFLSLIGGPRPVIGGLVNSKGETDQAYLGLTWTWDFWHGAFKDDDGFYVEGTLGGGWNDGLSAAPPAEAQTRKSLGSSILFREDVDIGYRLTPSWSIALSYNHISNADLGNRNEGLNDLGGRIGFKF
jgi:lipid A 3-O-deacylase